MIIDKPGTPIGPYEIVAPLGAGGMGVVVRARDTRLGRDVALKFLPVDFAEDPDRHARFEREAKLLASLNHPNIAVLYGLEHLDGQHALAMELVEGEGLDERIARGAVPVEEAIPIALQIAEALEAAHEKGIVHRDLKPANVRVRPDGTVKVLDFGLAKAWDETGAANSDLALSPTITGHHTRAGVVLGTAAYMSPEQARGRPVDKRADIWAFGCLLFEMLTGRPLFAGETVRTCSRRCCARRWTWPRCRPAAAEIRPLLAGCLDRDLKRRLRDIGEARVAIEEGLEGRPDGRHVSATGDASDPRTPSGSAAASLRPPARGAHRSREVALWVAFVLATSAALALWLGSSGAGSRSAGVVRASIPTPAGLSFATGGLDPHGSAAISPDGRLLVFPASSKERGIQLLIRPLDASEARPLPGTDHAAYPFWSPDSRSIGFFADGRLKTMFVSGGEPLDLCDAPNGRGGTWSREGTIVFAPSLQSALYSVPAAGGTPTVVTQLRRVQAPGDAPVPGLPPGWSPLSLLCQHPVPPADGVLRTMGRHLPRVPGRRGRSLPRALGVGAQFASSHLLFMRRNELLAVPFDPRNPAVSGEPSVLAENVERDMGRSKGGFTVSEGGTPRLPSGRGGERDPAHLARPGGTAALGTVGEPGFLGDPELSPDGRRVVVSVLDAATRTVQIWLYDLGNSAAAGSRSVPRRIVSSESGRRTAAASTSPRTGRGSDDLYVKAASCIYFFLLRRLKTDIFYIAYPQSSVQTIN